MRAVGYARVSSKAQTERQTIETQLRSIVAFISARGWTMARPVRTYVDDGRTAKSGHLDKRDGFAQLARDAAAGMFDVVVVFDLDRLTRAEDQGERGYILGVFNRAGVRVAQVASGQVLDLRTWEGDLYSSFQAVAAADWLRKHRERIMAGKMRAIAEGRKPAGPTPFGYSYDRRSGWAIHEQNAELVREMFRRVVGGESCQAIGDDLADRGYQRPRGGEWSNDRVYQILTARTYLGTWVADKAQSLTVPVPRIVEDELWYAAQAALARHQRRGLRRTKHVYLLEGLAVCALCGQPIGISSHGGGLEGPYSRSATYVCRRRRRPLRGHAPCSLPHQRISDVDARVWDALRAVLERGDVLERAVAQRTAEAGADRKAWAGDLKDATARMHRLQLVEETILARFRRGLVSEAAMDTELGAAARERALVQRQIEGARRAGDQTRRTDAGLKGVRDQIDVLRRVLRSRSLPRRRELVVALLGEAPVIMSSQEVRAMVRLRLQGVAPARAVGQLHSAGSYTGHESNGIDVVDLELVA